MKPDVMPPLIPGYTDLQRLIHTSSGAVYRAQAITNSQSVCLKVLFVGDAHAAAAAERFLEAAQRQAQLQHPNICRVMDFGESAAVCYMVTEWLPGGDLHARLQRGLSLQAVVKVVKDLARALDHAHGRGILHGDVKPENVLFRGDVTAVLTDFGAAQKLTRDPAEIQDPRLWGTPGYLSPEQFAGEKPDKRADLYSLGVVFYQMLTGDLPFRADASEQPASRMHQEPVPRLPNHLLGFQTIIDKLLARRASQRLASGAELVSALDALRVSPGMPVATVRTAPISTREIMTVGGDLLLSTGESTPHESPLRRRRQRVRWAATAAVMLAVMGGVYYLLSERSDVIELERVMAQLGLGEDPRLALAWSEAQSLRQDLNQGLAAIVAAYRRVLAIDGEHPGALAAVAGLATDWKTSISEAIRKGNLEGAQARLSEASAVFPNDVQWVQLNVDLQNRLRAERIMVSAQALLTSNGMSDLPSATAAIQSFQEVLRLAPENSRAQTALRDLALHYASLAASAAEAGEVALAINRLERASAADGSLTALDDVRRLISQAASTQATINELLVQARRYRTGNQLIEPVGENAAELYHRVLAIDPDNVIATQGLDEVIGQINVRVDQLLVQGQLGEVDRLVTQAGLAGMGERVINDIRSRLDAEQKRLEAVAENLAVAQGLMAQGYLTAPAERNAVMYLREVQKLDPGNPNVGALLQECAQRLATVALEAHEYGLLRDAEQYLDLALTITPEVSEWVALRERWATQRGLADPGR